MKSRNPPVGRVRFGDLRRTTPLSRAWGYDRGTPVDRRYIEAFLERHRADIRGNVLEIGDNTYTRRFGGRRVAISDVLHVKRGARGATIVGDLADGAAIPSKRFDCVILTQTLQLIYDVPAALATVCRILRPGGVLLATVPGITHIGDREWGRHWCWSFTTASVRRLVVESFPARSVKVAAHGNVLVAAAFLYGLAAEELRPAEFAVHDPAFELLITARAVKPGGRTPAKASR